MVLLGRNKDFHVVGADKPYVIHDAFFINFIIILKTFDNLIDHKKD